MRLLLPVLVLMTAVACNCDPTQPPGDGGTDAGTVDAGAPDAGAPDAGPGDGGDADACLDQPCLPGTTCTDLPAPGPGYLCSACTGAGCPVLRALAGPDREVVRGSSVTLTGGAVGANGAIDCTWTDDRDGGVLAGCSPTVTPGDDTEYQLTVTDRSGRSAVDRVVVRLRALVASAGPDFNLTSGQGAALAASWSGASCGTDAGCIECRWLTSDGGVVGTACTTPVAPLATTQYFLTVTDTAAGTSAGDSATVFVTDLPAQLCGWNVVVLTSNEYPSAPNPNYTCDATGTARRQTVNGKPAVVLSDLVVSDVRITGYISVETTSDDDLIGFLWGWQSPKQAYLLSWKQASQTWTAACGNAPAGIAIKKLDGALGAPAGISFSSAFGFNATDYVYSCADLWSQSRANANLLADRTQFLLAPGDPGAYAGGWRDALTYRFEFFYTPTRTRILVYEDDLMTGSTATPVASLTVEDSSYPAGAFAFFSNSQEQVAFGDFSLASLTGYRADAGADQVVGAGQAATLSGGAVLGVPPLACEWSAGSAVVASTCTAAVTPAASTRYTLTVTDDFGRVATDAVEVQVSP